MVSYKLQAQKGKGKWITVGTAKKLNASTLKIPKKKHGGKYRITFR